MIATLGVDADRTVHLSDVTRGHPGSLAAVVDRSPAPDILTEDKELVAGMEEPVAPVLSAVSRTDVEVDARKREPSGVRRGAFGLFGRCLLGVLGGSLFGMSPRVADRGGVSLLGDGAHDGETRRSSQSDGALEGRPGVGRGVGHVMFLPSVAAGLKGLMNCTCS